MKHKFNRSPTHMALAAIATKADKMAETSMSMDSTLRGLGIEIDLQALTDFAIQRGLRAENLGTDHASASMDGFVMGLLAARELPAEFLLKNEALGT